MNIQRIKDNKARYKQEDYRMLNEFYKQKIQQIHIVGEYANLMVRDYNAAHFVEIKTFHSYCFDLLGRVGSLEDAKDVVAEATKMIDLGEVEPNKMGKTVLVIDEIQDMSAEEYALVKALMANKEEMRVIAVPYKSIV